MSFRGLNGFSKLLTMNHYCFDTGSAVSQLALTSLKTAGTPDPLGLQACGTTMLSLCGIEIKPRVLNILDQHCISPACEHYFKPGKKWVEEKQDPRELGTLRPSSTTHYEPLWSL